MADYEMNYGGIPGVPPPKPIYQALPNSPVPTNQAQMMSPVQSINPASQFVSLQNYGLNPAATPPSAGDPGFWENLFNGEYGSLQGYGSLASGAGAILTGLNAWKQGKLAREQFEYGKRAYETNLENQATTVNAELDHRQKARNAVTGVNRPTTGLVSGTLKG